MMPFCEYKRCRKVSDKSLGKLPVGEITGSTDGAGEPWTQTVFLCNKHFKKIMGLLGYSAK